MAIVTRKALHGNISGALQYITKDYKTDDEQYVSGIGCGVSTAADEMEMTRRKFRFDEPSDRSRSDRVGYHIIRSFAPEDDLSPALANEIGCRLVRELYPGFEAVVATHVDRVHLHNHIVMNSVNSITGRKLEDRLANSREGLYALRSKSNELADIYGYSKCDEPVITTYRKRNYMFMPDTDAARVEYAIRDSIALSSNLNDFIEAMERAGYQIRGKRNTVYMNLKTGKAISSRKIADGEYSLDNINDFFTMGKPSDCGMPLISFVSEDTYDILMRGLDSKSSYDISHLMTSPSDMSDMQSSSTDMSEGQTSSSKAGHEGSNMSESMTSDMTGTTDPVHQRYGIYQRRLVDRIMRREGLSTFDDIGPCRIRMMNRINDLTRRNRLNERVIGHGDDISKALDVMKLYMSCYKSFAERMSSKDLEDIKKSYMTGIEGTDMEMSFERTDMSGHDDSDDMFDMEDWFADEYDMPGKEGQGHAHADDILNDEPYGEEIRTYIRAESYLSKELGVSVSDINDLGRIKTEMNRSIREYNRNVAIIKRSTRELEALNAYCYHNDIEKRRNTVMAEIPSGSISGSGKKMPEGEPDTRILLSRLSGTEGYFRSSDAINIPRSPVRLYLDADREYETSNFRGERAMLTGRQVVSCAGSDGRGDMQERSGAVQSREGLHSHQELGFRPDDGKEDI